jgi:hypothetical protein
MKGIKRAGRRVWGLVAFLIFSGCAAKKDESAEHFGTEVHHPKFKGPGDLIKSFSRVAKIFAFKKLDGGPVLRPWVDTDGWLDPAFREQLCLVVTMNNHCMG